MVAFVLITTVHTIVGELAPKSLAIQRTEELALASARPLYVFYHMAWPAIAFLNKGGRNVKPEQAGEMAARLKRVIG